MFRFALFFATVVTGLAAALVVPLTAQAAPGDFDAPGTPCGTNMVINTRYDCVTIGSFCTLSDGMIIGTIGRDGRCVLPGTNM
ncbi:hypothetical protein ACFQZZ_04255 [Nocardia sp. GCM10030253]|uniref:hypothetical protein n=1 Tax=Nocardia sp. GCM10030253 TaxID=3273404 RepID=UPI0036280A00